LQRLVFSNVRTGTVLSVVFPFGFFRRHTEIDLRKRKGRGPVRPPPSREPASCGWRLGAIRLDGYLGTTSAKPAPVAVARRLPTP
jgi:hypothetical protein